MTNKAKLTDVSVRNLKPQKAHYTVSDGDGLYLRVFPNGRKQWLVRKMSNGKNVSFTLGTYPNIGLALAREQARDYCSRLTDAREKEDVPSNSTLTQVFNMWLDSRQLRPSSVQRYKYYFNYLSLIANSEFDQIAPMQARAAVSHLLAKGKVASAKGALTMLGSVEKFACGLGIVETPRLQFVTSTIKSPAITHRRSIRFEELPQVFTGLAHNQKLKERTRLNYFFTITLLLLTLLRIHEACNLQWDYIDQKNACIVVPTHLMKKGVEHRVPITRQLSQVLAYLRTHSHGEFVFSFFRASPNDKQIFRNALIAAGMFDQITPHGVRSMARTYFAEQGFDFIASEYCLAHRVENAMQLSYQRSDYLEQRRDIMQRWADYVESCYAPYFDMDKLLN